MTAGEERSRLAAKAASLALFADLKEDPLVKSFLRLIRKPDAKRYTSFVSLLYKEGCSSWSKALEKRVFHQETGLIYLLCHEKPIPEPMQASLIRELEILDEMALISPEDFDLDDEDFAGYTTSYLDLLHTYPHYLNNISRYGFGDFVLYSVFRLQKEEGSEHGFVLKPVEYPDEVQEKDLIGYDLPRAQVFENTEILVSGFQASNVLLYGDAGTGKSATVKAAANAFKENGLRLIELNKEQLHFLPKLLDLLSGNPLKFILFIDDLSFQSNDDDFSALKAVLEGSVSVRSANTVIYATSNRRHIVRESFQARAGDEIHRNDTMQETISLSERFGLKVYFEKPKKELYLQIVQGLAEQYGLKMSEKELNLAAEQYALRKTGRSARAARQLVEQLSAKARKEGMVC